MICDVRWFTVWKLWLHFSNSEFNSTILRFIQNKQTHSNIKVVSKPNISWNVFLIIFLALRWWMNKNLIPSYLLKSQNYRQMKTSQLIFITLVIFPKNHILCLNMMVTMHYNYGISKWQKYSNHWKWEQVSFY